MTTEAMTDEAGGTTPPGAGEVGLILAVPFTVIAANAIGRLRRRGAFEVIVGKAQPTVKSLLD